MRKLWVMCSGDHLFTVPGKCVLTQENAHSLFRRALRQHQKFGQCAAHTLTIGASKANMFDKNLTYTFNIVDMVDVLEKK